MAEYQRGCSLLDDQHSYAEVMDYNWYLLWCTQFCKELSMAVRV